MGDFTGTSGDDVWTGTEASEIASGGAGNDRLTGGGGSDTLDGGEGDDKLVGGSGDDLLIGGSGNDSLSGDDGNDQIFGGDGNDAIYEYTSDANPADLIDGGDGIDRLEYRAYDATAPITIDLLATTGRVTNVEMIFFTGGSGTNHVLAGLYGDTLSGGSADDFFDGRSGDDFISGAGGNDTLTGGDGDDTLDGGDGDDLLNGGAGNDSLEGGDGRDQLFGGEGNDHLYDYSLGPQEADRFDGGAGDDQIESGWDDVAIGGDGIDTLMLEFHGNAGAFSSSEPVVIDLRTLWSGGVVAVGNGSVSGFERLGYISGSYYDDVITVGTTGRVQDGFAPPQVLGWYGNDILTGGDDRDSLDGGSGDDQLFGLGADDGLSGRDGNDRIEGGAGNDTLNGGAGADILVGGSGNDTYFYSQFDNPSDDTIVEDPAESGIDTVFIDPNGQRQVLDAIWAGVRNIEIAKLSTLASISGPEFVLGTEFQNSGIRTIIASADIDAAAVTTGLTFDVRSPNLRNMQITGGSGDDVFLVGPETILHNGVQRLELEGGSGHDIVSFATSSSAANFLQNINGSGFFGIEGLRFLTGTDPVPGSSGSDRYGYPQSYVVNPVDSWIASGTRFEIDASSLRGSVIVYLGADGAPGGVASNADTSAMETLTLNASQLSAGRSVAVTGGAGADQITGSSGDDNLIGGAGDDIIDGGDGDDVLLGGSGNDRLSGGSDADTLYGEEGDDFLYGKAGDDGLFGGSGNDTLYDGLGADILDGGTGTDSFFVDLLSGFSTADKIIGGADHDTLFVAGAVPGDWHTLASFSISSIESLVSLTGSFRMSVEEASGFERIETWGLEFTNGGAFVAGDNFKVNEVRLSDAGNTIDLTNAAYSYTIIGGAGSDIIYSGGLADTLSGGGGADVFRGTAASLSGDRITDFSIDDSLIFADAALGSFTFTLSGSTLIYSGGSLTLNTDEPVRLVATAAAGGGVKITAEAADIRNDFNGDGRSDLFWRSDNGGTASNWLGEANGGFTGNGASALSVGLDWHVQGFGDFNGDGRDDVLWRNDGGTVAYWYGLRDGGFEGNDSLYQTVSDQWHIVGTGDFNGDGKDDVLWRGNNGTITNWLGQANGTFVSNNGSVFNPAGLDWHVVGTGDFNGDGRDDVLWRNDGGTIANWLGQPDGGFVGNPDLYAPVSNSWRVVGIGDFNGDGRDDIAFRHSDGTVTDWLGQANGSLVSNMANANLAVGADWHVSSVGDYNGDGRDDILWRHDTGTVTDWLGQIDGGFVGNSDNLYTSVGLDWHVQPQDVLVL